MRLAVRDLQRSGLAPVSFALAEGECLAVRGPSGAGKTLMLRAIADLDPNDGAVSLDGRPRGDFSGPEWRRHVGYLPAEPGWWADHVGAHFIDWHQLVPLAARIGLPAEAGDWPLTRPSTGERLRLALLRALEVGPRVLLLDEPTAALDQASAVAVEALLAEQQSRGLSLVWVTHDDAQAQRDARRRLVIEAGHVHEEAAGHE